MKAVLNALLLPSLSEDEIDDHGVDFAAYVGSPRMSEQYGGGRPTLHVVRYRSGRTGVYALVREELRPVPESDEKAAQCLMGEHAGTITRNQRSARCSCGWSITEVLDASACYNQHLDEVRRGVAATTGPASALSGVPSSVPTSQVALSDRFGSGPLPPPVDEERRETVNHPRHYNAHPSGIECIVIVEHMTFNAGNAVKYLWRAGLKGAEGADLDAKRLEDHKKAAWYINREIERLEAAQKAASK